MAVDATTNRYTGEDLYVSFQGVEISTDIRSFSVSQSTDIVEITAGDDASKGYIARLKNVTLSTTILQQGLAGGTAIRAAVQNGASGTLIYGPEGTASGKPKYTVLAIVTGNNPSMPYNDLVAMDISWQMNGAYIENYDTDGDTF